MCRTGRHSTAGFSALETIVVVAIILVFSAFGVLYFSNSRKQTEIEKGTTQFKTMLSLARSMAVNQNARFQAVFSFPTRLMWIDQVDDVGQVVRPKVTTPRELLERMNITRIRVIRKDGTEVLFTPPASTAFINFYSDSSSDFAAITLLHELDDPAVDENFYSITLYPSTGIAKTFPNEKKE